jgi:hypothetical protein
MCVLQPEDYDFISNFSTLWAVFLGAILATVGGFAATQIEWFFERRRRERNAALFFGEVLSTLTVLLRIANDTRGRGDPYGPLTMRILRTARREIDIYDRNRESLLDLRDSDIRARIHTLTLRIAMPIDNIFDATQELNVVLNQLRSNTLTDAEKAEQEARVAAIRTSRDNGFDFAIEEAQSLQTTIAKLEPIARTSFKNIETIART